MKTYRFICLLLALFVISFKMAQCSEIFPCPAQPIRLAYYAIPLLYGDNGNSGMDVEFINELQARTGCQISGTAMPRNRAWQEFADHHLDMLTAALKTPERNKLFYFIPYGQARIEFIGNPLLPARDEFLKNPALIMGVVRGIKYGPELQHYVDGLHQTNRVVEADSLQQLFLMLKAKRFSVAVADSQAFSVNANMLDLSEFKVLNFGIVDNSVINLAFSRQTFSAVEIKNWQMQINNMIRDGTARRIMSKYMSPEAVEAASIRVK